MVAETVFGTGRLGAAAAVKREDTDEVTSKAKRRGVNLAANEESVEAKRLVQKVAKEATAPTTTRSTAENFAVEIRRIETEGATAASGGSVFTKLQLSQKEEGKRMFGKCRLFVQSVNG